MQAVQRAILSNMYILFPASNGLRVAIYIYTRLGSFHTRASAYKKREGPSPSGTGRVFTDYIS